METLWSRFCELGKQALDAVASIVPQSSWFATQLSDMLDANTAADPRSHKLNNHDKDILSSLWDDVDSMSNGPDEGLVIWSPPAHLLGRLLGCYSRFAKAAQDNDQSIWPLSIVAPAPLLFGCATWGT